MHYIFDHLKAAEPTDGDTIATTIDLGVGLSLDIKLRLFGIDCPERNRIPQRAAAEAASEAAGQWIEAAGVASLSMVSRRWDKYGGRLLGDLVRLSPREIESRSLGEYLVATGYAKRTDENGRRSPWLTSELLGIVERHAARKAASDAARPEDPATTGDTPAGPTPPDR